MRTVRHWSPTYIRNRLGVIAYERIHPDAPWLTQLMVTILSSWLTQNDAGLEWGSGRSTLWLAQRVARLTSVEHDQPWYESVSSQLGEKSFDNVNYLFRSSEAEYVAIAQSIEPESLDFCLVDGIARDLCALASIPLLKRGGVLIVDNCNWYLPCQSDSPNSRNASDGPASEEWKVFQDQVETWRSIWTTSGVSDTCLWVKPA